MNDRVRARLADRAFHGPLIRNVQPDIVEPSAAVRGKVATNALVSPPKQFPHHIIAQLTADTGYKYSHSLSLFLLTILQTAKPRQDPNLMPTIIHHYLYFVNR